jgi:hypothetical protein
MNEEEVILYKPGVCNIGPTNRLLRMSMSFFFLTFSYFSYLIIEAAHYGIFAKALLVFPLYAGFLGLYQAVSKFCVLHAKKRTYDMR